jgi:hypothetical protein
MYSEKDLFSNVNQINNILNDNEFCKLKNIINSTPITCQNIFSTEHFITINLFDNEFIRDTIFSIIKSKFDYLGVLQNVICKIQNYSDTEKYNIISEDKNSTIFSLDINSNNLLGENDNTISTDNIIDLINNKPSTAKYSSPSFNNEDLSFNKNDPLIYKNTDIASTFSRDFNLEKQNILDNQGYLFFISPEFHSIGLAYEHINNNCIKFPGYFIHKNKPYFKFSNARRISIIFTCKNI